TPLSLGIETLGGVFTKVIDRNTTIPTKKSQIFSTAADGQTSVEVVVYQGERQMAADNKKIGDFRLDGIPAAPRGVPQIEVSFDIDANGIVHVSAKDLGTGKEQQITITASSNMSKEDIDKAVKDAEQYAEVDKKRREEIDTRNAADQMIYTTEKSIADLGDKIPAGDKTDLEAKVNTLKEAVKGSDIQAIKNAQEDLQKKFYEVTSKVYQQQAPQQGPDMGNMGGNPGGAAGGSTPNGDGYVDADFREVDENDNK
ncbi:MAG TPA: Hsp70 family protein, partial [Firmicutes bacterium]|nr:Hsp70 family protein [Bacillota bacterium]